MTSHVLGIDVGTATCVVVTIKQGVLTVVTNEISSRKTPALVSYSSDERLIGEPALSKIKSNCSNTARHFKLLLGRSLTDSVNDAIDSLCPTLNSQLTDEAGFLVTYGNGQRFMSATEALAGMLSQLKATAETFLGASVLGVVIAVPSWFTHTSRLAVIHAARIASLPCLGLANEHIATVVDYGMYRNSQFTQKPMSVAFVAMGHSSLSVCVTQFTQGVTRVLAERSVCDVGGRQVSDLIVREASEVFKGQTGTDPMKIMKSRLKLQTEATRALTVLSANPDTTLSCEYLDGENDLTHHLTRSHLEKICEPVREKMRQLIQLVISDSGLSVDEIDSVEIAGGSSRMPWAQQVVREEFHLTPLTSFDSPDPLSETGQSVCSLPSSDSIMKTLNLEETVARGATLIAAMLCPKIKVANDFLVSDKVKHSVSLRWSRSTDSPHREGRSDSPHSDSDATDTHLTDVVFERGQVYTDTSVTQVSHICGNSGLGVWFTFYRQPGSEFEITLFYTNNEDLPSGIDQEIGLYRIMVPKNVLNLHNDNNNKGNKKIKIFIKLNRDGIISVDDARVMKDDVDGSTDSGDPTKANAQCAVVMLKTPKCLMEDQVVQLKKCEEQCVHHDHLIQLARAELNGLESFVYSTRVRLQQNGDLYPFCQPHEREWILAELTKVENWLHSGPGLDRSVFYEKKNYITKLDEKLPSGPFWRYEESVKRPEAVNRMRSAIRDCAEAAKDQLNRNIDPSRKRKVLERAKKEDEWLTEHVKEQQRCSRQQDPSVTCRAIDNRARELVENVAKPNLQGGGRVPGETRRR
eukprot:GHVN01067669.1.p1 GENE.GHVN01067669.1~~GHVN01067669.1.p1  ORF type:complete len:806 (+),score=152.47 GHVN01067669.1:99-2516(+)